MANKLTPEEAIRAIKKELERCYLEYQTILNFFNRLVRLHTDLRWSARPDFKYTVDALKVHVKATITIVEGATNQFEPTLYDINKIVRDSHLTPYAWRMIGGALQRLEELTTAVNDRMHGRRIHDPTLDESLKSIIYSISHCPDINTESHKLYLQELKMINRRVDQVAAEIVALQVICKQFAK